MDFTLEPQNTLVVGMTGSGKTTFVNRLLLNSKPACRFIFDDLNRMWPRLKLKPCYTAKDCEDALPTRWVAFQPLRMFPGDTKAALRWFCHWVFNCAQRGPGEKMVCIPEVWRHCTEDSIPVELALIAQAGRELGTHLIVDTQRPEQVNPSITGASTELVCFKLISPESLRAVGKLGAEIPVVQALPVGTFKSYNRLSGGTLSGRVF